MYLLLESKVHIWVINLCFLLGPKNANEPWISNFVKGPLGIL